jgi:hypothetical protein
MEFAIGMDHFIVSVCSDQQALGDYRYRMRIGLLTRPIKNRGAAPASALLEGKPSSRR